MAFTVQPDGSIKTDTAAEAIELARSLAPGVFDGAVRRGPHRAPPRPGVAPASASPSKRGRKAGGGHGGVHQTGSGKWRCRAMIAMQGICGPSRATREEAEGDLAIARDSSLTPDERRRRLGVSDADPVIDDPIEESPHAPIWPDWSGGGPTVGDGAASGPVRASVAQRVIHVFDAPTTGTGFAACGAGNSESLLITGIASAVTCRDCKRLISENAIVGLNLESFAPKKSPRQRTCSYCNVVGHQFRSCPQREVRRREMAAAARSEVAASPAVPVEDQPKSPLHRWITKNALTHQLPPGPARQKGEPRPVVPNRSTLIPANSLRVRARSVRERHLTRIEKSELIGYPDDVDRPLTREDCKSMPRPCPFVTCSHHLYLDVNPESGTLKLNFPHLEVWEMAETCSLDVADRGGITLEEVGAILNLTRERIRQVEVRGLSQMKEHGGDDLEGLPPDRQSNAPEDTL